MMTEPQNDSLSPADGVGGSVSHDNFGEVWSYILAEIESGRWDFADWPLENLQEIPLIADAQGVAVNDLNQWVNRHLKAETQHKMFQTIDPDWSADISKSTSSPSTEEPQASPSMDTLSSKTPVSSPSATQPQESFPSSEIDGQSSELVSRSPSEVVSSKPADSPSTDDSASELITRPPTEMVTSEPTVSHSIDGSTSELITRPPTEVITSEPSASPLTDDSSGVTAENLITNKVTAISAVTPDKTISYAMHAPPTAVSRLKDETQPDPAASPSTQEAQPESTSPSSDKEPVEQPSTPKKAYEPENSQTILNDNFEAKQAEFEANKAASEIILSEKTRNRLLQYRDQMFGEGSGSMELAIRQLLDGVERTLSLEIFQRLIAFQSQNSLTSTDKALNKLLEITNPTSTKGTLSPADSVLLKEELEKLLSGLKSAPSPN
jgi:hypothetical protein